jgi:tetratricopeptide (TPR) repeat protein
MRNLITHLVVCGALLVSTVGPLAAQPPVNLETAIELYDARKHDEAARLFEQLVRQKQNEAIALQYLGRIALQRQNAEEALGRLERSVKIDPSKADTHYWLAQAYGVQAIRANVVRQVGLARKARAAFEEAVRLDPKHVQARSGLLEFYLVAPGVMGGSVEKARAQAREIRKLDPLVGARVAARIHVHEKNFDAAEKEFVDAQRRHSDSREPRFWLGLFYTQREDYPRAFAVFEEMLRRDPSDSGAIYQIGRVAALSGQNLDRGAEHLRRYLQLTPKEDEPPHAAAWFRLGEIHQKAGRTAEARTAFRRTLELDPSHKGAAEALEGS